MGRLVWAALLATAMAGCISPRPWNEPIAPPVPILYENPMPLPPGNPEQVWETLVDVVNDYFHIEREMPVRVLGNTLTEGRIDTFPEVGSTIFEPWRQDSADSYEKLESTLQSIRRQATVRVIPSASGYLVEVAVFKELEDVVRPAHATAGSATFRSDNSSLVRVVNPIAEQDVHAGWIPLGRDRALEQRILGQLRARFNLPTTTLPPAAPTAAPASIPSTPAPLNLPPPPTTAPPVICVPTTPCAPPVYCPPS